MYEDMDFQQEIESGSFAPQGRVHEPHAPILVVDWNIDRGQKLAQIIEFLAWANADLILLQEVDLNTKRTRQLHIARDISQKLRLNYVFGREFQELTQGSATSPAYHGQATLSPWNLSNSRILRFRSQSHFWRPRWFLPKMEPFQERIGGRMALVSEVSISGRKLLNYNLHLESRGNDTIRYSQMEECLDDIRRNPSNMPIVLAGDLNLDLLQSSAPAISQAQLSTAVSGEPLPTTPSRFLYKPGRPIDWILTRGPVRGANLQVHSSVSASDHYPVSLVLHFIQVEILVR